MCDFPDWGADKQFLITAETAFGAAIGYDWLYDWLDASRPARKGMTTVTS